MGHQHSVFFFSTWKTDCLAWKNIKKCPWKSLSVRENFEKKQCVKIRILYVKKNKNCMRENKKVPVKNLGKSLNVPFFGGIFQFCVYFFGIQRFLYFWSKILCVKLKTFAWKISILCAWKIKANAWNFLKKSTWKAAYIREKNEKKAKKSFHAHFFFSRRKKKHCSEPMEWGP